MLKWQSSNILIVLHKYPLILFQKSVELVCRLPHLYPSVLPQVFIRAPTLSRSQHRQVSEAIQAHLETLEVGDLLMGPLIEWLQANVEQYLQDDPTLSSDSAGSKSVHVDPKRNMFSRMWIYSHHIYSKIKRKDILEFADELHLSGFSMPGKPGIIVIEGHNDDVETFWGRIRRMQWKKLTMKEKEDTTLGSKMVDDFRKFEGFEEKYFEPRQGKGRGAHADRGLLYHFLAEKGCGHIFNMYFHVDGKMGDGDIDWSLNPKKKWQKKPVCIKT